MAFISTNQSLIRYLIVCGIVYTVYIQTAKWNEYVQNNNWVFEVNASLAQHHMALLGV